MKENCFDHSDNKSQFKTQLMLFHSVFLRHLTDDSFWREKKTICRQKTNAMGCAEHSVMLSI